MQRKLRCIKILKTNLEISIAITTLTDSIYDFLHFIFLLKLANISGGAGFFLIE